MADEQTVDVRWLEPPEPFERVVNALDSLPPDTSLRVLIHREPHPLYRWLMREGYRYQTRFDPEGWFEIRISRD
jgi:uncharacterized protein (DUF2249 family)